MAPRDGLEAAAATYLVYYRNHLNTEESEIIPAASELLMPEDWAEVMATVPRVSDPLFGNDVQARFGELRKQIAREQSFTLQG
jgi:hemerythrin-like domain-containing protein